MLRWLLLPLGLWLAALAGAADRDVSQGGDVAARGPGSSSRAASLDSVGPDSHDVCVGSEEESEDEDEGTSATEPSVPRPLGARVDRRPVRAQRVGSPVRRAPARAPPIG